MADPNGPGGTWNLVFEDTFPGTSLNTTYWQIGTGVVNNVQCFASNVIVNNGLTLQLANSNSGAEIFTHDAYNLPVGSVAEARIWFPGPGGVPGTSIYNWPAWWVSGPNWPNAGEIDIAEGLGTLTVNYHGPGSSSYNTGTVAGNWSNSWHTYTVRRNANSFDIWYDGVLVRSNQKTADNGQPQNMILNVGAANTAAYGAASYMLVSYVRQWAPASSGGGNPVANVNVDFTTNVAATDPLGAGFVISEFGGNPIPFLTNNGGWNTSLTNLGVGHMRASLAWYGGNPSYGAGGSPGQQGSGGSVAKSLVGAIKAAGAIPLISFNGDSNDNNFQPADGGSIVNFFNAGYGNASGTLTQTGGNAGQQFQTANAGPYLFQFNEWNSTQALSCPYSYTTSTGATAFSVASSSISVSTSGAPGAYPSLVSGNHAVGSPNYTSPASGQFPIKNSAISPGQVLTSVSGSVPGTGAWDFAYDIWFSTTPNPTGGVGNNGSGLEMMIWLNHNGGISPAGSPQASVTIGGTSWTPWVATNGPISYVRNTTVTSVTNLDLQPFIADAINRGLMTNAWYLIDVECGFEIWTGGAGLAITNFSCTNGSAGLNNGPVHYWSIGNEPEYSGVTWNTTTYQAASGQGSASATLAAMHAADPTINIGIPTAGHWNPGLLSWAAGVANIGTLSYHAYDGANTDDTSAGAGPFPSGKQIYNHIKNDLPAMKAGINYGIEEMNWHSSYSGMTQFNDWHDTCFLADNIGQALSAGGHATVYSDSNGALGLLNDNQGQGQLGTYGSPQPAYWALGIWCGMNGQFKRYGNNFVSASSTFSNSTLTVYATDNGKIVIVNKDGGSAHAVTIGMTLAGGATTGTYNVWATNQGSPGSPITKVVSGASFSGGTITYTVPAGTAVSIDVTAGSPVKNLIGNAALSGSGRLAAGGVAPGGGLPTNSFAGGTNGATITPLNSGGISGTAFDAVSVVAGGVAQFSATQAIHSPLSGAFSTGTTSGVSVVEWLAATVGTQTTVFGRAYVRLTGNPSADDNIVAFYGGSGSFAGGIMIATSGQLRLQNATFGEVGGGPIMPLNQWFRLEWKFICGPAGSANATLQYFSSADSIVVSQTLADSTGQYGVGGSVNEVHWGWTSSHPNQPLMYQANIGLSNTSYLGPVSSAHPAAAALGGTGTLSAATAGPALVVPLNGAGILTAGQGNVHPRSVALSGKGTLTSTATQGPFFAVASMSVAGLVIKPAAAAFSASTSMTVQATVPLMIARPVLSAAALVTDRASASFTAPGSLAAVTSQSAAHLSGAATLTAPGRAGAVRMLAGTSLTASGQYFMPGQAALYGGAVLSAAGKTTEVAAAHLSASTALAANVLARIAGTAALSAPGHLTAAAQAVTVPLSAAAHLSATATRTARSAAALHAAPSVTPAAQVTERAAAALHAAAVLSPSGKATRFARVSLAASAALRAPAVRVTRGQSALSAAPVLRASGRHIAVAPAALSAAPVLHAAGNVVPGTRLSAAPSLSASGKLSRTGQAAFSAGAHLSVAAKGTTFPAIAFTAASILASVPLAIAEGRTALAVSPSLAALAGTQPGVPFPVRSKGQQPAWQRDVQGFAIRQERQRHAQALWQFGELVVFCLMWRPRDIEAGLAQRCTRCFTPAAVIPVSPAQPDSSASAEAQISAAYGQGSQFRCTLCYGTQVIAARAAEVPGVRALLVRPAILTDTDQNQQRTAKGVVNTGSVQVQSTPDFRVHTLDYFFRSDGRRYQLQVPARTTLRTGFATPWQAAAGISYNLAGASLEDPKASVAYIIPPSDADLARVLGTYTRIPADYAWFEQVNGPLIPEETPPPAASGSYQPPASLLR